MTLRTVAHAVESAFDSMATSIEMGLHRSYHLGNLAEALGRESEDRLRLGLFIQNPQAPDPLEPEQDDPWGAYDSDQSDDEYHARERLIEMERQDSRERDLYRGYEL